MLCSTMLALLFFLPPNTAIICFHATAPTWHRVHCLRPHFIVPRDCIHSTQNPSPLPLLPSLFPLRPPTPTLPQQNTRVDPKFSPKPFLYALFFLLLHLLLCQPCPGHFNRAALLLAFPPPLLHTHVELQFFVHRHTFSFTFKMPLPFPTVFLHDRNASIVTDNAADPVVDENADGKHIHIHPCFNSIHISLLCLLYEISVPLCYSIISILIHLLYPSTTLSISFLYVYIYIYIYLYIYNYI